MAVVDSLEELRSRREEIKTAITELHTDNSGDRFTEEKRSEWNRLNEELDDLKGKIEELEARDARIAELADKPENVERAFHVGSPTRVTGNDIYDLGTLRSSPMDTVGLKHELRDRALRSVEEARFGTEGLGSVPRDREQCQAHVQTLLDRELDSERFGWDVDSSVSRRVLVTGSPTYKRAFSKYIAGRGLSDQEQRALALGTGSAGGFAVVYTLDPTVVPTSNFSVNPFRAVARIEQLTGTNEWKAITSGAITAAYGAEATQASDNAPTLAQPDILVEKAQAFVPFSIEVGQDWEMLQTEMASLLQDAKDDLEATKFAVGAGHGSTEPKGIITAATATTTSGGVGTFAIADLYKVLEALPPRFRPRAQWMGNLFTIDKIRQFDTAGGSGVWIDGSNTPDLRGLGPQADAGAFGSVSSTGVPKLLGRAVWESTAMASALTTGSKILVIGDWRYFVIVDRIGLNIEFIQNLVGANQRPTGQRGLYAYWRNSSDVLSASAFQVLVTG